MPTGYTATLCEKGQDFRAFALNCAHAFGACVTIRDNAPSDDIPEFKPDDYYLKALKTDKDKLRKLRALDDAARLKYGEGLRQIEIGCYENAIAERQEQNRRLANMRITVESWSPPTSEHVGLKDFMIDQLNISHDDTSYYADAIAKAKRKTAAEYADEYESGLVRSIASRTADNEKEVERTNSRNAWVKALKASLPK